MGEYKVQLLTSSLKNTDDVLCPVVSEFSPTSFFIKKKKKAHPSHYCANPLLSPVNGKAVGGPKSHFKINFFIVYEIYI